MKHVEIERTTDAPTLEPAKQLLWDAAQWMQENGWQPNASGCAMTAIHQVAPDRENTDGYDARELLREHIGMFWIDRWSDASDQATVIAAMRAAALS